MSGTYMLVELNNLLFILNAQHGSDAKKVQSKYFVKERLNQPGRQS